MLSAGIDIGSRSIECAVLENGKIRETRKADTGFDPAGQAKQLIKGLEFDVILATGYGRNLFEIEHDAPTITEIKAHARGAFYFFPGILTVLDIGGQDSKVMKLSESGKVIKFEMNDRCAAGTGKFLEIMAKTLGFTIENFGNAAGAAKKDLKISSMCTVFAESEVTSLVAKGENTKEIARGLHTAVVKRAVSMLNRVSPEGPVVFTGGVANNPFIIDLLSQISKREIFVPDKPEMNGAVGAALLAMEN
ncbi:CoA enzyme activase domain-containing protein [Desulfonema limicola]|uniref:CoA enzyme activase domain-containing protein n=1 Tax=Desulfonema limicola TaxID=45656 RepID=A0A975GI94_9BACT|nr:acyl-CoA dehydratase activase [Desulfonema limicola]QTA82271.1 CoA enzyme activase domain-containing protein [Desulfonema limicola]